MSTLSFEKGFGKTMGDVLIMGIPTAMLILFVGYISLPAADFLVRLGSSVLLAGCLFMVMGLCVLGVSCFSALFGSESAKDKDSARLIVGACWLVLGFVLCSVGVVLVYF